MPEDIFKWFCLECKEEVNVDLIEKDKACPNCGCQYFNVWRYQRIGKKCC